MSSQSIVVEILDAGAPTGVLRGQLGDAGAFGDVVELLQAADVLRYRRLYLESVTQRSTWPSSSKSANTGPMAEVFSPFCP